MNLASKNIVINFKRGYKVSPREHTGLNPDYNLSSMQNIFLRYLEIKESLGSELTDFKKKIMIIRKNQNRRQKSSFQ